MKKGTLVYTAGLEAENFCRGFMLDGALKGGLGVAAASLPRHISLGMPYEVKDFDAYLAFAQRYAKTLKPLEVTLTDMACAPLGEATGSYCFRFETGEALDALRLRTVSALREELGLEVPEQDGVTGSRNITLGFGKAPYAAYEAYTRQAEKAAFQGRRLLFDGLGVFYYDEAAISASTFFCCRYIPLA